MKLLLYCTKSKPRLFFDKLKQIFSLGKIKSNNDLNGKIVGECDFEVEELFYGVKKSNEYNEMVDWGRIIQKSCLSLSKITEYLNYKNGYAIHIKNLKIFDKPKELSDYYTRPKKMNTFDWYNSKGYEWVCESIDKAPQNMMYALNEKQNKEYILISIQPQWLVRILNHEKTIEVRKKVLKEMLKNG